MRHIYLDHAASTPVDPRVIAAMAQVQAEIHGNASSVHWFGRRARAAIDLAREQVAAAVGAASPHDVIFTASGSESVSLAICGVLAAALRKSPGSRPGVIISRIEHSSALQAASSMADRGVHVTEVAASAGGIVDPESVRAAIVPGQTKLVSLIAASNEIGVLQPIAQIAEICREHEVLLHTDAVHAFGRITSIDVSSGAFGDLVSIAGHKVYGPKGAAALVLCREISLLPIVYGGSQEGGWRGGSENTAAIVGLGVAAAATAREVDERIAHLERIGALLVAAVMRVTPAATEVCADSPRVAGTLSFTMPHGIAGRELVMALDLEGVAISTGSACASGTISPSRVLAAIGMDADESKRTVRISAGRGTTIEDVSDFAQALARVVDRVANASQRSIYSVDHSRGQG